MNIDHIAALFNTPWQPGDQDYTITGTWVEDGSTYEIRCPPQLRTILIQLQRTLARKYAEVERLRKELSEAEDSIARLIG